MGEDFQLPQFRMVLLPETHFRWETSQTLYALGLQLLQRLMAYQERSEVVEEEGAEGSGGGSDEWTERGPR